MPTINPSDGNLVSEETCVNIFAKPCFCGHSKESHAMGFGSCSATTKCYCLKYEPTKRQEPTHAE